MDDLSSRLSGTLQNLSTVQLRKCNSPQTPVFSSLMMGFINLCYLASNISCPLSHSILQCRTQLVCSCPPGPMSQPFFITYPTLIDKLHLCSKVFHKVQILLSSSLCQKFSKCDQGIPGVPQKKISRGPVSQTMFTIILDTICLLLLFSHTC